MDLHINIIIIKVLKVEEARCLELLKSADIPVHIQDARQYHELSRYFSEINPKVVIHLAAVSHANRSNKDPHSTFDHSLRTLENALDNAKNRIEHFIFISSSMVYGNFMTEEVDEQHPLEPIGIYGALKVAGEKIVIAYQQVFDLPYTIVRPSALYGPGCISRRVGQIFIENALGGSSLRIDGDGAERLDFTYVEDLIEGISLTINNPSAQNEIFNLTYGNSRSINDLAQLMQYHFEDVDLQYVERDNLMPFRGTLSISKAQNMLGFSPQHPLEAGIEKYVQWYRDIW